MHKLMGMLCSNKISLTKTGCIGKFKKIEIIPSIFSDHNAVRLDLNYRTKTIKNSNIWRLNNTLLNNQSQKKSKKKSKFA